MNRNRRALAFTAILLIITVINYSMLADKEYIRTIQFLYIFVMGALSGVLLTQIVRAWRRVQPPENLS